MATRRVQAPLPYMVRMSTSNEESSSLRASRATIANPTKSHTSAANATRNVASARSADTRLPINPAPTASRKAINAY